VRRRRTIIWIFVAMRVVASKFDSSRRPFLLRRSCYFIGRFLGTDGDDNDDVVGGGGAVVVALLFQQDARQKQERDCHVCVVQEGKEERRRGARR